MKNTIPLWELPGGIHPPENKSQSTQLPLANLPIPTQLIIPLNQHAGTPAKPIVTVGERVLAGQLIGEAQGVFSAHVHASSSGTVTAIRPVVVPHPSGMTSEAIVIDTDGKHEWIQREPCENYSEKSPIELVEKIRAAGVAGLGGAGFPTDVKLQVKSTHVIDTLIINGAECEPYITADDMLMQNRAADIIAGSFLLSYILHNPQRIVIGVEDNKPKAIEALTLALKNYKGQTSLPNEKYDIEIAVIPTKYPSGGAKQLIYILTGRETPNGHHSSDIGVICINVGTVAAAWRAVVLGEPLISRVTTVVGESLTTQRNIDVLIGTPIQTVLNEHGFDAEKASRVIMGGSMMGFTLPDLQAPVIKTTNCILAPSKKEAPPPPPAQACIRCGLCAEVCPVNLLPQQLFWYAQSQELERLEAYHIFDCIECGACSYVCPSTIPLVQYYRAGKGAIRTHRIEKEKADRARERFEFRKNRIEKEEAEKEEKRLARKQAAEEAKQLLAEQKIAKLAANEGSVTEVLTSAPQLEAVVTAVVKANSQTTSTDEQRAKLERMLGSARNSLASAKEPLVPRNPEIPITDEQRVKQQARIKQAELKLAEAEKKLAEFNATNKPTADTSVVAALARVQAKMSMTPEEKKRTNLQLIENRLQKARERLSQAESENDSNVEIFRAGVKKLEEKLKEIESE